MGAYSQTSAGTYDWECPVGVFSVTVALWGAGGGGSAGYDYTGPATPYGGGGGGGGEYAIKAVSVTPGNHYSIVVGLKGSGGTTNKANGTDGANSTFASTTVVAIGGKKGYWSGTWTSAGGAGGTGGTGDTTYRGGNGYQGGNPWRGGGGGSSAGTDTLGGDAYQSGGGTAPSGGGNGGAGGNGATAGTAPGGAGGGGGIGNPTHYDGANGADGKVSLTWTDPSLLKYMGVSLANLSKVLSEPVANVKKLMGIG